MFAAIYDIPLRRIDGSTASLADPGSPLEDRRSQRGPPCIDCKSR